MATAQLRKTFRYPLEYSDDDDIPGDLDEEGELYLCCLEIELIDKSLKNRRSSSRSSKLNLKSAMSSTRCYSSIYV